MELRFWSVDQLKTLIYRLIKSSKMRKRQNLFKKQFTEYQDKLDQIMLKVDSLDAGFNTKFEAINMKMNENFE